MRIISAYQLFLASLLCALPAAFPCNAAAEEHISVSVEPEHGTTLDTYTLTITVDGREEGDIHEPVIEDSENFRVEKGPEKTDHAMSFGVKTLARVKVEYIYFVYPRKDLEPGKHKLPKAHIGIRDKEYTLKRPVIEIVHERTVKSSLSKAGLDFTHFVDNPAPYVGQQITYRAVVAAQHETSVKLSNVAWQGFWRESFGDQFQRERSVGSIAITSFLEALYPLQTGTLNIPERDISAEVSVPTGSSPQWDLGGLESFFPDFFWKENYKTIRMRLTAESLSIDVRALPPAPPDSPSPMPVGKLKLKTDMSGSKIKQGENITITITVSGDANLRSLKLPKPSGANVDDFRLYPDTPQTKAYVVGSKIKLVRIFRLALVPLKSGSLQLPKFTFISFDPETEEYIHLQTMQKLLTVMPGEDMLSGTPHEGGVMDGKNLKHEVSVIAEDLLPQHMGHHTFQPKQSVPIAAVWLILVTTPVLAIALRLILLHRSMVKSNPEDSIRRKAYQNAIAAIKAHDKAPLEELCEKLEAILKTYLSERFSVKSNSLTNREAYKLLEDQLASQESSDISERAAEILSRLQKMRFSGLSSESFEDMRSKLLSDLQNLLSNMERIL